ncbi:peptidyl-tRNA hydrolase [Actinokineospora auranticolor]|uniref:peptidyl-tRNA hydrolase n=1 Tax=Actinokineospora auranticolor TaxID=155976 RepID=A0A2S6GUK1_9PSEU|nr:peptidyl-tRNA hydrolase [Actinokineospora auranticolor]PPK68918.1 peptidyl-tRNA hydrolase [Actinokineospora auranticolor]
MTILDPLAARYVTWMSLPAHTTNDTADEDPTEVRAMPIVLRVERDPAPLRTPLLEAAAAASLAVCLDPRAEPEGPWHSEVDAWVRGRIRKVSRRARGAHWAAVQELPGITVTVDGAEARAFVPGKVVEAPKVLSRLQISGSELPDDTPGPIPTDTPVLWLNPTVPMTVGKAAAQVGHATMLLAAQLHASGEQDRIKQWTETDLRCAVRTPSADQWTKVHPGTDPKSAWETHRAVAVRDAGFTEVAPGTVTVIAQWA